MLQTIKKALLNRHGVVPSMSGRGCCYDNAVSESFFSGFKNEVGDTFPSRRQAVTDTFEFIETYYNPSRRHRINGNISPRDAEAFFARNGRKPTGIKDLIAETYGTDLSLLWVQGGSSRVSEFAPTPLTAVVRHCTGVQNPSI